MGRYGCGKPLIQIAFAVLVLTPHSTWSAGPPPMPATPFTVSIADAAGATPASDRSTDTAATNTTTGPTFEVRPRLYALDCGSIHVPDMGMFSDTGEYDGQSGDLVAPCFVVTHPSGNLLWDAGLGDHLAGKGPVTVDGGAVLEVQRSIESQLQLIGVKQIDYLAFSHFHFDHTGNARLFRKATWLLNTKEQAAAEAPNPFIDRDAIQPGRQTRSLPIDGDHDVFGDGSVKILAAPGHTPGHQVLLVKLAETGPVILSGDLYHTRANRRYQRVPTFNVNRADTLASMNRIETLAKNIGARIIIQHDPEDFAGLPKAPAYLQ